MKNRIIFYPTIGIVCFFFMFAGCTSKKVEKIESLSQEDFSAIGQPESLESQTTAILEGRTTGPMLPIYFDFDTFSIRDDQRPRIEVNSDYLKDNSRIKIRVEGNCDPKGTREYNLALGEKRALSAEKYLVNLGVSSDRITTVSFGEEKILFHGHDDMVDAQNRRVDFVVE